MDQVGEQVAEVFPDSMIAQEGRTLELDVPSTTKAEIVPGVQVSAGGIL